MVESSGIDVVVVSVKVPDHFDPTISHVIPALIRRTLEAEGKLEVWGSGKQTRSFMYIDDCVQGIHKLIMSERKEPLNLGTDRLVKINQLLDIVSEIAGKKLTKRHDLSRPQGVRGRNSDNTRLRQVLEWEPSISLEEGLATTYHWIEKQLKNS